MILGYFDRRSSRPAPMVWVAVHLPGLTDRWVWIPFMLDSGAAVTCLHPRDALTRLGMDRDRLDAEERWPRKVALRGVGGQASNFVVPARFGFRHADRTTEIVEADLHIAQPTLTNESLPSLLGRDLLQHFQVTLDWPADAFVLR